MAPPLRTELTPKMIQALAGFAAGKTRRQIANDMNISESTLKNRLTRIYRLLGVRNSAQACVKAYYLINGDFGPSSSIDNVNV